MTLDPIDRHALLTRIYEYPPERDGMSASEWYRKCIYEAPSLYPEILTVKPDAVRNLTDEETDILDKIMYGDAVYTGISLLGRDYEVKL